MLDTWEALNEGLPVLRSIDLDVYPDETLVILGKSGAGKSTLLHLMGALDRPNEGSILYEDQDIGRISGSQLDRWRNSTVGYVFQFYHLFPDLSAIENVLLPASVAYSIPAYLSKQKELNERANTLLEQVGLGDRAKHRPSQLSGGEQQRVAIARALLLKPRLLLCDEPTGNLDRATGSEILELLWKLKEENGQTYVIVTHDDRLTERADRVVLMEDGRILSVEEGGKGAALLGGNESSSPPAVSAVAEPTVADGIGVEEPTASATGPEA
ncbi:MAG: ABC transporter ATP-binding protein [Planctomycetes bacterium]|nr:ABC transporter ATP-binding protein [Planctomycetota bacterium]